MWPFNFTCQLSWSLQTQNNYMFILPGMTIYNHSLNVNFLLKEDNLEINLGAFNTEKWAYTKLNS